MQYVKYVTVAPCIQHDGCVMHGCERFRHKCDFACSNTSAVYELLLLPQVAADKVKNLLADAQSNEC